MRSSGHVECMSENLKGRGHLEAIHVNGRIHIKTDLREGETKYTICFRTGLNGGASVKAITNLRIS
jgi:hypothetical protein